MNCDNPIFICGHIKTGTSLMAALLDSHPKLNVFPEELFLFSKYGLFKNNKYENYDEFWDIFFNDIQIKKLFGNKASGLFGSVDYSDFDATYFKEKCKKLTENKPDNEDFIIHIYESIFNAFSEIKNSHNKRCVEKTPMNEFNFIFWKQYYPNAKFIYMKREPFEVYSSIKKKRSVENIDYSIYNFIVNYKTSLSLANYFEKEYPNHFKIVELNTLKNKTKETMESISKFIDIQYRDTLLKPTKLNKSWGGNSMFAKNKFGHIKEETYRKERKKIIDKKEISLINKYLNNRHPIVFDFNFLKYSLKAFIKVTFTNLWLNQFIKKQNHPKSPSLKNSQA